MPYKGAEESTARLSGDMADCIGGMFVSCLFA